jgi:DDE family transposase
VIGKAEHLDKGSNPRFIVTSLDAAESCAQTLYERLYCARGEMENRIKECQLDLGACPRAGEEAGPVGRSYLDRDDGRQPAASVVLVVRLRAAVGAAPVALPGTELAQATCGSIRSKLLKLGARVTVSVRRIKIAIASACPHQADFALAHARLRAARLSVTADDGGRHRTETCARGDSPKSQPSPQHRQHGKPPLRRPHHYRKIVSYHPIPPAKPASAGSR